MSEADSPARRRVAIPGVVWACCLVLLGLFAIYRLAPETTRTSVLANLAFVPARTAIALDVARGPLQASVQRLPQDTFTTLIGAGGGRWWTLATYPLLDAGWLQLSLSVGLLAVFGTPVARRLGAMRLLALLLAATLVGALAQFAFNAASFVPVVGASPAVSSVLGAAVRFLFPPGSGVGAVFAPWRRSSAASALSLAGTLVNRASLALILVWVAYDLVVALYPVSAAAGQPAAWPAAAAGFLLGAVGFPLIDPRRRAPADARLPEVERDPVRG